MSTHQPTIQTGAAEQFPLYIDPVPNIAIAVYELGMPRDFYTDASNLGQVIETVTLSHTEHPCTRELCMRAVQPKANKGTKPLAHSPPAG